MPVHERRSHLAGRGKTRRPFRGRLAADDPGLAAVPAVEIEGPVAVEHDVGAGKDLLVLEPALHRQGGVFAGRVAHHQSARIAHESTELDRRHGIGMVQILAGPALLPARDGAPNGFLVEARGSRQQFELDRGLDGPGVHERVIAVGDLDAVQGEPPPKSHVIEADAAAVDAEVPHRGTHLVAEVEPVGGTRPLHPLDPRRRARDVGINVVRARRTIHGRHHRPARPDVLDPRRLVERRGQVVVGEHHDGMLGLAPGQDHDVGSSARRPCGRYR